MSEIAECSTCGKPIILKHECSKHPNTHQVSLCMTCDCIYCMQPSDRVKVYEMRIAGMDREIRLLKICIEAAKRAGPLDDGPSSGDE